jgi:very-short-patch-repair endonuclease
MDKLEFIARQLSRTEKKRYEHYVASRIFHQLDDLELKFITQQRVSRPSGIALTDVFFPQIQLHIEIDEPHHLSQVEHDRLRTADIINATGHRVERIPINNIEEVNLHIKIIVELIRGLKAQCANFIPWNIDSELDPRTYINRGFVDIDSDCAFRTMVDAANCFGHNIKPKGIWKGGVDHPREPKKCIWFPKLYENAEWRNSLSHDENEIRESSKTDRDNHFNDFITDSRKRIVFAHAKGPLGDTLYRFKGEYELDVSSSSVEHGLVWKRINTRVATYSHH